MQPWIVIDRARAEGGAELVLARRGEELAVRAGGQVLMSSRAHLSEEALAKYALERAARKETVFVGGLGLGYTLRAALDLLGPEARVVVVELVPAVVAWNQGPAAHLAGRPLDDPRVRVQVGDVGERIAMARRAYDAILLDVDNGPTALAHPGNDRLYGGRGVAACREALRSGGVLGVWSAGPDEQYRALLERGGFSVEERRVRASESGGARHTLYLARAPARRPADAIAKQER